ncbi:MAG TPA: PIN domain-containing protein, partial [Gammaproteobacteria bacterium]|nr:PIN domain-containing protein [Gammaproteobacteria bacterium]
MRTASLPRLFVLDTNVLMHDPTALFRFQEHDIYLPMGVLEELDALKKGVSEVARNARQVSRFLDELIGCADREAIERGLTLPYPQSAGNTPRPSGRLFLETHPLPHDLPPSVPGNKPDNLILSTALALQSLHPDKTVILVSKDINLRIKARVLGVHAEDYY